METADMEGTAQRTRPLFVPLDRMMLVFVAALAAVAAVTYPTPLTVLPTLGVLAVAFPVAALWGRRSELGRVAHAFLPLPVVVTLFNAAGPLIGAANAMRWDGTMATLDAHFFGSLVQAWRHLLGRPTWLSDLASVAYVSYYFIPFGMCIALWVHGRWRDFDEFAFALIATLLVSYVGYFLFPTTGPRVPQDLEAQVLGGGVASIRVRDFLRAAEVNQLDAFPSGHTALSLVFLFYGWRLFPRWSARIPLLLSVVGIVFATVYLSLHYVIDLCAGATQAALMPAVAPYLQRAFGGGGAAELGAAQRERR
ncbi:MAG TPA: phosphatase PAP2 family protein [Anaeromyxobacteraceae bacterium]|nr:phosphatase PAP2 family protein [Anaeromyxobacteraceae bacterium]